MVTRMLVFFAVMSTVMSGIGYYVGSRLIPSTWTAQQRTLAWAFVALVVVLQPATFIFTRFVRSSVSDALAWVGFSAMGLFVLTLSVVFLRDLGWWSAKAVGALPVDPARREALFQATSGVALSVSALLFGTGFARVRRGPSVVQVNVPIKDLPDGLVGFRIVQLSDVHVGPTIKSDFIDKLVHEVNALGADMVALTGDIVDGDVETLGQHTAPFARLQARHGVFMVTGNHEYYSGALAWLAEFERLGMKTLVNAHHVITHNGASLAVAGVPDITAHNMVPAHQSDPQKALTGAPSEAIKLLLAHQPRSAYAAQKAGAHLQLSGHTHAGQFFPGTALISFVQPFAEGLHRHEDMWVYTNRGTGYWGPPIRHTELGEITCITLTRAT